MPIRFITEQSSGGHERNSRLRRLESSPLEHKPTSAIMYERKSPEAPLRGSKTTNTSQLPPPHRVQTTRANAQQRRRVASRRIASPKRHRASSDSHRGTHLRRESPAIAKNIQANLKMTDVIEEINGVTCRFRYLEETSEEWLAHLREVEAKEEAKERRKDEAGAKAAQELADKKLRHLNKKVRDDPTWPNNCTHRIMDGEVPLPQLDEIIHVPDHPELKICDDRTGASSNFGIPKATEWNKKFGKKSASELVTLQTSKGDLTFKKKNKNVDGQKTVAGYCCSVEGKEYWIHDSNKPTLYPPTYLAFEQHKYDADPDYYNSREAILEEYRYLGFPGNKTPKNIQRCRTDWLSTVMPIIPDYYRGSVNYFKNYLNWFKREHPQIYQEIHHGNSPGARAHARAQFHELVRERRNQMSFNELAYNGVGVQFGIEFTTRV